MAAAMLVETVRGKEMMRESGKERVESVTMRTERERICELSCFVLHRQSGRRWFGARLWENLF